MERIRDYPCFVTTYVDGTSQRQLLTGTSRRSWKFAKRLTPSQLSTLRTFYQACNGNQVAFYFYDPWETSPLYGGDPTGAATVGRHTVRFNSGWTQSSFPTRSDVDGLELLEIA
jgi:hypothetical protein